MPLEKASLLPDYYAGLDISLPHTQTEVAKHSCRPPESFRLPQWLPRLSRLSLHMNDDSIYIIGSVSNKYTYIKIERNRTELIVAEEGGWYIEREVMLLLQRERAKKVVEMDGLIGYLPIMEGGLLVIITSSIEVGVIASNRIYEVKEIKLVSLSSRWLKPEVEERYRSLLTDHGLTDSCYFSYTYDMTRSLQTNMKLKDDGTHFYNSPQGGFFWNKYAADCLGRKLKEASRPLWILPVIKGYYQQRCFSVQGGRMVRLTLLARRSRQWVRKKTVQGSINLTCRRERGFCGEASTTKGMWQMR